MAMTGLEKKQAKRILSKVELAYHRCHDLMNVIEAGMEFTEDPHCWQGDLDQIQSIRDALELAHDLVKNIQREVAEQNGTFVRKVRPIGAPPRAVD